MQTLSGPLEQQVTFKGSPEGLRLLLPLHLSWEEVLQQLQQRLDAGERLWSGGFRVTLECQERLVDAPQLEQLNQLLAAQQMSLYKVATTRRQTAVAAAVAGFNVEQLGLLQGRESWAEPLYLQQTLRSGVKISHPGSVVIIGDINPGGEVYAQGDILVWGKLRGLAHAGSAGNERAVIFALQLVPMQLRIADFLARAPEGALPDRPEVAYVREDSIHIALATEFRRKAL
jgi:septum site-determining protein MinC